MQVIAHQENHAQPKREKKNSCPRKLPNPHSALPSLFKKVMAGPWFFGKPVRFVSLESQCFLRRVDSRKTKLTVFFQTSHKLGYKKCLDTYNNFRISKFGVNQHYLLLACWVPEYSDHCISIILTELVMFYFSTPTKVHSNRQDTPSGKPHITRLWNFLCIQHWRQLGKERTQLWLWQ